MSGGGERKKGGHVLRDTTSRGLFVRIRPPHTSERRGGGGGCEQGGWQEGERRARRNGQEEPERLSRTTPHPSDARRYRVIPAHRNWQIETVAWIWPSFFHCALETRWLGVRKTCGIGLFYRNYRPLLQETGWLGSDFISVCLETRWLGQKPWFLFAGLTL